jgi:hypothetical protein
MQKEDTHSLDGVEDDKEVMKYDTERHQQAQYPRDT